MLSRSRLRFNRPVVSDSHPRRRRSFPFFTRDRSLRPPAGFLPLYDRLGRARESNPTARDVALLVQPARRPEATAPESVAAIHLPEFI